MPQLPDQATLDTWLAQARQTVQDAQAAMGTDDVEVRIHGATGQVVVIVRDQVKPGEADGTAGTPQAPETPTDADRNATTEVAKTLATGFRDRGARVELNNSEQSAVITATFDESSDTPTQQ